jgi:ABC-2 type transport system ATP-binding protein
MIRVKDLKKSYRDVHALKGVSFQVSPGELFAYLGPNVQVRPLPSES